MPPLGAAVDEGVDGKDDACAGVEEGGIDEKCGKWDCCGGGGFRMNEVRGRGVGMGGLGIAFWIGLGLGFGVGLGDVEI